MDLPTTGAGLALPARTGTQETQTPAIAGGHPANGKRSLDGIERISDLRFGDLATTSTQDRYGAAKAEFEGLLAKARGGDLEAAQGLSGSAERLLGLGRDMYASGADYAALYQQTTSALDLVAQMGLNGGTDPTTVAVKESNDWLRKIWNGIEKMAETGMAQIRQQAAISERASEEQGQALRTLDEIKTETKRTRQAGRGVLA